MKIDRYTLIGLGIALLVIFGLAGWGHLLALDPAALSALRTGASALAVLVMACLRALLSKDENKDGIPDVLQRLPLVLLCAGSLTAGMWLGGCGANAAQVAISSQAEAVAATQPARFDLYEAEHDRCLPLAQAAESYAVYADCMAPARHVARASDSYVHTLRAAQAAVHAGNGAALVPCVIESAGQLVRALSAANAPIPSDIAALAALIPEGGCHGPE